jgi:hypothetical protein
MVFNILEGDMLVTSVESKEVWVALLEKIDLKKVEQFTKLLPANDIRLGVGLGLGLMI